MEMPTSIFGFISAILRLVGVKKEKKLFDFQVSILDRAIVAEAPKEFGLTLVDSFGDHHQGVYITALLLWNKGSRAIRSDHILGDGSLTVNVNDDSKIISFRVMSAHDEIINSVEINNNQSISISIDCINPGEYIVFSILLSGNPMTEVCVLGRIEGQSDPIDRTADEARATVSERIASFVFLVAIVGAIPFFLIGGFGMLQYDLNTIMYHYNEIAWYWHIPFSLGLVIIMLAVTAWISRYFEKRKYPDGYPLRSDFEPTLPEFIKGQWRCFFRGKKQRISSSIFNWGEPVLLTRKKTNRRSVDDWIR